MYDVERQFESLTGFIFAMLLGCAPILFIDVVLPDWNIPTLVTKTTHGSAPGGSKYTFVATNKISISDYFLSITHPSIIKEPRIFSSS